MKISELILGLNKNNKMISLEYLIGILLAFSLWGYHLLNTAYISQSIAKSHDYKLNGLHESYFGWKRDFTDIQWRNFRNSIPIIFTFAFSFLFLSNLVKKFTPQNLRYFYFLIGLGYAFYLHNIKVIFLLLILLTNFILTKILNGGRLLTISTWIFCCSMKILSEIYRGFTFKYFFPSIDESCELGWQLVFGLIVLRMISFNIEYNSIIQKKKESTVTDKIDENNWIFSPHCNNCKQNNFCLKYLTDAPTTKSDYNVINYFAYIFYPPLYFSGPTILFNSFIFQVKNAEKSQHQYLLSKEKIIYILRYIFVFISFEIFNSFIYVNAYLTANKFLWSSFDNYIYSVFCFFLLIFIWFKFTVIWRTSRLWAWIDGIYTEENMNRCMYNNYCFEGFWRAWHRSFNVWLIRYIFIPLGGSRYKLINIWVVFSFVALWHDLQLNLLIWGWFICLFMIPEIIVKKFFNQEKFKYLHDKMWFRFLKYLFCAFYIVLMIIANLIGFGMGHEGLFEILINMMRMTSLIFFIKILIFLIPSVVVMFYVREKEQMKETSNKY